MNCLGALCRQRGDRGAEGKEGVAGGPGVGRRSSWSHVAQWCSAALVWGGSVPCF